MSNTLNPGNEPEFYIPHDQLPDTQLKDIKLSPDSEYLTITGANALTYIYRRKADGSGFYKLNWSCQHGPSAKSVINFIGFDEHDIHNKFIIFLGDNNMIYQYELIDDTLELRNTLDISACGFSSIDWLICLISPSYYTFNIVIMGIIPSKKLEQESYYDVHLKINLISPEILFNYVDLEEDIYKKHYAAKPTKQIHVNKTKCQIFMHRGDYWWDYYVEHRIYGIFRGHHIRTFERYAFVNNENNETCTVKYTSREYYKNNQNIIFLKGHKILEIKAICQGYIIMSQCGENTELYTSRNGRNLTHILTYNNNNVTINNIFILTNSYNCSDIAVPEYDSKTNTTQLRFVPYVLSTKEKKKFQASRISNMLTSLIIKQNIIFPPELISIVARYI